MNIRRASFATFAALAVLGTTWGADDEAGKKEMKKLEGDWRLVSAEDDGEQVPQDALKNFRLTLKGDTFKCTDGSLSYEGTYKVIEVKGKVRKSDVTYTKPELWSGKIIPQLAEWLDDDTFRVCIPTRMAKELKRPTKFTAEKGSGQGIVVFKREKK